MLSNGLSLFSLPYPASPEPQMRLSFKSLIPFTKNTSFMKLHRNVRELSSFVIMLGKSSIK